MTCKRGCLFLLLAFFLLFTGTAAAVEEITQDHTKYFSLEAPEGLSLSGVYLYDLDPNSNTTLYLDNYGKTYTLQINSTKSYLSWWEFEITLTNPNGTVQTKTLSSLAPYATDYDFHVQYYWQQYIPGDTSSYDSVFDIDVYTGILPLEAAIIDPYSPLATQLNFGSDNLNITALKFSEISVSSTSYFDLICFAVNEEEFASQYYKKALGAITEGLSDFFSWTWDAVLSFVEKIPGVGPYLASILEIAAIAIDSIIFYFDLLFIDYPETTFLTVESFILASAFCRRGNFWTKINRVCNAHLKIIELFITLAESGVNMMSKIISAIADAVNALKPV